jgi:hypothetical protein
MTVQNLFVVVGVAVFMSAFFVVIFRPRAFGNHFADVAFGLMFGGFAIIVVGSLL